MKVLKFYLLLLLLGSFLSCHKKEYPKPLEVVNSAVYYSRLTIDNQPIVLQAGIDGYYMYSSFNIDSNFLYNYVADLKKSDCSNCTKSLKIQINDYAVSLSGSPTSIDSSLRKDLYPLLSGNPNPSYKVQFSSTTDNSSVFRHHWDFGQGMSSEDANPVITFNQPGIYTICLTTWSGNSSNPYQSSICNKEKIGMSSKSCVTQIVATPLAGNSVSFDNITQFGTKPYQYLWNFGDGTTSTLSSYTRNYSVRGSYPVTLRVIDASGDTAYANYNVKTLTDNSSSIANYSISTVTKLAPVPAFSQVTVTWTDENGVVYSSNNSLQPGDSYFQIVSVSENDRNEKGQATKKINAKFKCKLYNGNKSITVSDADVVISVAYNH